MIWPHLFYKLHTAPLLLTLLPRTLALLLSANVPSVFTPQGVYTAPPCLEADLLSLFVWPSPFIIQVTSDQRGLPWPLWHYFLLPPSTCPSSLFYFYPSIYHFLKFSYVYTCLWPVLSSNMFRAVSSVTRVVLST